ncbi:MAG: nicotinate-nucleotide adenylyltransferase [Candidatus Hydrogenedentota bacterium]
MGDAQHVGVFGGTFDPIHITHLAIAHAAREQAWLDKVLFVVSGTPPHKNDDVFADARDRYDMVAAATANEPCFAASRIEIDRDGPSYTADTLRALHTQMPGAALFLILGFDSLVDLPRWREPETILEHAHLLAVPRPELEAAIPAGLEGHYTLLDFPKSDMSSTAIRERLFAGEPVDSMLPPAVARLIEERGLYREQP